MDLIDYEPSEVKFIGRYLDEDGVVADVLERVSADPVAIQRWLDPQSWGFPLHIDPAALKALPEHAGCLMFAATGIRNFYGLWHANNPHTVFGLEEEVLIEDGIITDPKYPDNFSFRVIERVKAELAKLPVAWSYELATVITPDGYSNFEKRLSWTKPSVPEGSIRNLTPLVAGKLEAA